MWTEHAENKCDVSGFFSPAAMDGNSIILLAIADRDASGT